MNKVTSTLLAGVFALGLAVPSIALAAPAAAAPVETDAARATQAPTAQIDVAGELSSDEIAGLTFMREEEKVARDVYLTLYDVWGSQVFSNIAHAEQTHMDAVAVLLDRYGIADPAAGNAVGEFTNPDLQALYDHLLDLGSQSLADALTVGAVIEETDIADLIEQLAAVEHSDIQRVYENLENGSENHLRAYVSTLQRQTGETYEPQILDLATYDKIIGSSSGHGRRQGRRF